MSDTLKPPIPLEPSRFLAQEYDALRDEILKRTEIQHQLISLALIASGTLVTIGVDKGNFTVLLAYPILSLFLCLAWCQSDVLIGQIGKYIRERIEVPVVGTLGGWEVHLDNQKRRSSASAPSLWVAAGIFVGTQIFAVVLYTYNTTPLTHRNTALVVANGVVIVSTLLVLVFRSKLSPQ